MSKRTDTIYILCWPLRPILLTAVGVIILYPLLFAFVLAFTEGLTFETFNDRAGSTLVLGVLIVAALYVPAWLVYLVRLMRHLRRERLTLSAIVEMPSEALGKVIAKCWRIA